MKKLMRKLVLSSFALGLAVITLSTTTFAWYTSNTEVKANNIIGQSSTSGSDLLMITQKWDTTAQLPTEWGTTVNVTLDDLKKPENMLPVCYTTPSSYDDTTIFVDQNGVDMTTGWIEFKLYFKLASAPTTPGVQEKLYLSSLVLTNETKVDGILDLPSKDVLSSGQSHIFGSAVTTSTYKVDVLRSLMVSYTSIQYVQSEEGGLAIKQDGTNETTDSFKAGIWNPEKVAGSATRAVGAGDSLGNGNFNAHKYYNLVMEDGKDLTQTDKVDAGYTYDAPVLGAKGSNGGTQLEICSLPSADSATNANSYLEITFRIFINGWDLACFDACQGQKIQMNLGFTTVNNDALSFNNTAE